MYLYTLNAYLRAYFTRVGESNKKLDGMGGIAALLYYKLRH